MDFNGLVNVADSGDRYREMVTQHYMIPKYKIHEKSIHILYDPSKEMGTNVTSETEIVFMNNIPSFLKTLRHFGNLITSLDVEYLNSNETEMKLMGKHINEYCRSSLISISCTWLDRNMMNEWVKSFENLERVFLGKGMMSEHTASQLNKLFPKIASFST